MGERIFPELEVLDRRQLLGGAVAATAIKAVPAVAAPQAVNLAGRSRFSFATCSRIEEIAFRNGLRKDAGLPMLSVAKELRRMKTVADEERFRRFTALHRKSVRDEVLKLVRDEIGDPNWRPTGWIAGMGFQARVDQILRHRYQRCRNGSLVVV
jgi:hypothetical protein